jgi:hypothetical protein
MIVGFSLINHYLTASTVQERLIVHHLQHTFTGITDRRVVKLCQASFSPSSRNPNASAVQFIDTVIIMIDIS